MLVDPHRVYEGEFRKFHPAPISGFIIAWLALDKFLQGSPGTEQLLLDILGLAVATAEIGGAG